MDKKRSTDNLVPAVLRLLRRLQRDASKKEGERQILNQFNRKVERVGGSHVFLDKLQVMYRYFVDPLTSKKKKALLGAALLYFIMPMDVVADIIPGLGWVDDGVAALFVWNLLKNELNRYERGLDPIKVNYKVTESEDA